MGQDRTVVCALVSETHGKERIRRKVIRRDGTARYHRPRIKLDYLRNLMPHEPVFVWGPDPSVRMSEDPKAERNAKGTSRRSHSLSLFLCHTLVPSLLREEKCQEIDTNDRLAGESEMLAIQFVSNFSQAFFQIL